jgi:predicted O-linked N-acetylglucosamine transferase (SPINDLY family)
MATPTIDQAMQIALAHHRAGRLADAEALYRRVLEHAPEYPDALHLLGVLAGQAGHVDAAIDLIARAIAVAPDVAEYHNNLGKSRRRAGRLDEAVASLRHAIALNPGLADAHNSLGTALRDQGRLDEAIAAYGHAIGLRPDLAEAHSNLGVALREAGRPAQAIAALRRAIELRPDLAEAHNNLGIALFEAERRDEAIAAYGRAIELRPDHAEAYGNLAIVLHEVGRLDEALAAYGHALALRPDLAGTQLNPGPVLKDQGRLDEALAWYRKAAEAKPDDARAGSDLLLFLHFLPEYDAPAILEEHRRWAQRHAAPLSAQARPHDNDRSPDRRLRVGYVSTDFREHPVGRVLLPLLANHDRRQFEVVCYSDARVADALTDTFRSLADRWCPSTQLDDQGLADQIRDDRIDILVDLGVHTAGNRMLVFARKPAPVQVSMLGNPTTTGLDTVDYRLTDPYFDPPGQHDDDYAERSIRLPHCIWCYLPPEEDLPVAPLPAFEKGFVTFGSLNQFAKASPPALTAWREILRRVPGSRLALKAHPGSHREAVCALFRDGGVDPDRVEFIGSGPRLEYFRRYDRLDLGLDPFPYNGHTSTLDAIWMGVPVVTLAGRTAVGRGGVSVLSNLGLPELIARTPEEYVEIAARRAEDRPALAALRAGLRQRMRDSPLMDAAGYAAAVEAAYRAMWQAWCGRD